MLRAWKLHRGKKERRRSGGRGMLLGLYQAWFRGSLIDAVFFPST